MVTDGEVFFPINAIREFDRFFVQESFDSFDSDEDTVIVKEFNIPSILFTKFDILDREFTWVTIIYRLLATSCWLLVFFLSLRRRGARRSIRITLFMVFYTSRLFFPRSDSIRIIF